MADRIPMKIGDHELAAPVVLAPMAAHPAVLDLCVSAHTHATLYAPGLPLPRHVRQPCQYASATLGQPTLALGPPHAMQLHAAKAACNTVVTTPNQHTHTHGRRRTTRRG